MFYIWRLTYMNVNERRVHAHPILVCWTGHNNIMVLLQFNGNKWVANLKEILRRQWIATYGDYNHNLNWVSWTFNYFFFSLGKIQTVHILNLWSESLCNQWNFAAPKHSTHPMHDTCHFDSCRCQWNLSKNICILFLGDTHINYFFLNM